MFTYPKIVLVFVRSHLAQGPNNTLINVKSAGDHRLTCLLSAWSARLWVGLLLVVGVPGVAQTDAGCCWQRV